MLSWWRVRLKVLLCMVCRSARQRLRWDKYKHDLVQGILWGRNRQDRLVEYTNDVKKFNGSRKWR